MTISKKGGRFSVAKTTNPLTKRNDRWMRVTNGKGVSEEETNAGIETRPESGGGMDIDSASDDGYEDTKMDDTEEQAVLKIKERIGRLEEGRKEAQTEIAFLENRAFEKKSTNITRNSDSIQIHTLEKRCKASILEQEQLQRQLAGTIGENLVEVGFMKENEEGEIIDMRSKIQLTTNERGTSLTNAVLGTNMVSQESGRCDNGGLTAGTSNSTRNLNRTATSKPKKIGNPYKGKDAGTPETVWNRSNDKRSFAEVLGVQNATGKEAIRVRIAFEGKQVDYLQNVMKLKEYYTLY